MKNKWMAALFAGMLLTACSGEEAGKDKETEKEEPIEEVSAENETAVDEDNPTHIFKEGTFEADVMAAGLPADMNLKLNAISKVMQASLQENADWYMETLAGLKEGEPLPYDEKLGITQEQYDLLLSANDHMTLGKVGESDVIVTKADEGLTIEIPSSKLMKKLTINTEGTSIQSDAGELSYDGEITASDNQKVTGKWDGYAFVDSSKMVEFSFGELEESGDTIIYMRSAQEGQETQTEILIF
ncbi:hypothetical protein [Lysinibacillus sp. 3P01SB]|uniref:hypothetical protein n=1 Tax=Lysinibacillus sp. 3P01SB TaxID=3132284 RepID=UPI0039A60E5D